MIDEQDPDVILFRKQERIEATRSVEWARVRESHPAWADDRIQPTVDMALRQAGLAVYPSPEYFACIRGQKKAEQAGKRHVDNLGYMKGIPQ